MEEKEKKEEKKKGTIKKVKPACFDKKKQNVIKTLSNVVYILAKVFKVFVIIGIVFSLFGMIITPAFIKNIDVSDDSINVFGYKISFENTSDDKIVIKHDNLKLVELGSEDIYSKKIINEINEDNKSKIFSFFELNLLVTTFTLMLSYFMLTYIEKLFMNIYKEDTPFTEENLSYVREILVLYIVCACIPIVSSLLSEAFFGYSNNNSSFPITLIFVLFVGVYLFEYACILQKNSKLKMYE